MGFLSLKLQGGLMGAEEARAFEAKLYFADEIRLRRFDDGGKRAGWVVPGLESHRAMLTGLLLSARTAHARPTAFASES